jgi:hypothetical protein
MGTGHLRALCAFAIGLSASAATAPGATIFLNEVDYDQPGTPDAGEFVEIAGAAGDNLGGWKLQFINSANVSYANVPLPTFTFPDSTNTGWGFFIFVPGSSDFIQNGTPAGIRLLDPAFNVVEFISYDGVLPGATQVPMDSNATTGSVGKTGPTSGPNSNNWIFSSTLTPNLLNGGEDLVPEPAGLPLLVAGAAAGVLRRRRAER